MANLRIEGLPDALYQSIQTIANAKKVSLNDAAIQMLAQAASTEFVGQQIELEQVKKTLAEIQNFPRKNPTDFGLPDSTLLIQEDRNR